MGVLQFEGPKMAPRVSITRASNYIHHWGPPGPLLDALRGPPVPSRRAPRKRRVVCATKVLMDSLGPSWSPLGALRDGIGGPREGLKGAPRELQGVPEKSQTDFM